MTLRTARSFLFAPGGEERKLVRALESGADAVIADLEDAVAPAEKARARDLATRLMTEADRGPVRLVRVNGVGTEWHDADLAAVNGGALDGIVLPKATEAAVRAVADRVDAPIVAIVETARGLREAFEIASHEQVVVLVLGAVDLGLELRLEPRADGQEILFARSSLVVDSAAAGLRGPVDRVWVDVRDLDGLARDCVVARSLGLRGKALVHPDQVGPTHEAFAPSAGELRRAREIVAAHERGVAEGRGVVALDGEMIDVPVVERARELLSETPRRACRMSSEGEAAPKEWRGRFYEDFAIGEVYRSRFGRTVTRADNIWFTCLTMNTNPMHFDEPYAARTRFERPLVNSAFTLALVTGLTVPDTSENAAANLEWTDIKLPKPVFEGDTLHAESEILDVRESASNPSVGIVTMRCRGINQRGEVVIEFRRTFMVYKRGAPEVADHFPHTGTEWTV